jgi:hypothetical protein
VPDPLTIETALTESFESSGSDFAPAMC